VSTHYDAFCVTCNQAITLGLRCAGTLWFFGHGSGDEEGRKAVGEFIQEHAGHDLRIVSEHDERLAGAGSPEGPETVG
jgi:hypothetical protein